MSCPEDKALEEQKPEQPSRHTLQSLIWMITTPAIYRELITKH
jgi:hypothetical protein